jgi:hypothetical protein
MQGGLTFDPHPAPFPEGTLRNSCVHEAFSGVSFLAISLLTSGRAESVYVWFLSGSYGRVSRELVSSHISAVYLMILHLGKED